MKRTMWARHGSELALRLLTALFVTGCNDQTTGDAPLDASATDALAEVTQDAGACETDLDCDDGNPCTLGVCRIDRNCQQQITAAAPCDDGDACTTDDACDDQGACAAGAYVALPTQACQSCSCDPTAGVSCTPLAAGMACDDGDCCSDSDVCQACDLATDEGCGDHAMRCVGVLIECDDENDCTDDACLCSELDVATCVSSQAVDGSACVDNPNICTTGDTCLAGQCIPGDPLPIDDGNPCTEDYCEKGIVYHDGLASGQCDDGDECTKDDFCYFGNCTGGDTVICAVDPCASSASCVTGAGCVQSWLPAGAACDDGNPCTTADQCDSAHVCVAGVGIDCSDLNPCTVDACEPDSGDCTNEGAPALEGLPCVPDASCATAGLCQSGTCAPVGEGSCDDGNPCTTDTCDPATGCTFESGSATDGQACTLDDPCIDSAVCDAGSCAATSLLNCDDGDLCTLNECIPGAGCQSAPDPSAAVTTTCQQANAIDDGACCCFADDPTGEHSSGHVLDVGPLTAGTSLECCITPGFSDGCSDTAWFDVSTDGTAWSVGTSFATVSQSKPAGGWESFCQTFAPATDFRYVRGANDSCYVDHFSCTVGCDAAECTGLLGEDCDDGNPCTVDSCDPVTGCDHLPIASDTCIKLHHASNLVSFRVLPDNPVTAEVLAPIAPWLVRIMGEGTMAMPLPNGQIVGNLSTLERTAGYWITLDLPAGLTSVSLPLTGAATDPDIAYSISEGLESISFPGPEPTPLGDALLDPDEAVIDQVVGEGIAAFKLNGTWVGNLSTLAPNRGYEVAFTEALPALRFACASCDGSDPYLYGCKHPQASNFAPAAEVDDGSCTWALPVGWATPGWSSFAKAQGWVVFHDLQAAGAALQPNDAVAAWIGGQVVGVGFPIDGFTTVPMMNGTLGDVVTFTLWDASQGSEIPLVTGTEVNWSLNLVVLAGCTDPGASNYADWADVDTSAHCVP